MVASNFATCLIIFKTSKALIIAWRSDGLVCSYVGLCWAQLWTAVYAVHGHSLRPSSALVPLDIERNWVDKSSTLLYEESLHLLSFCGSCWKKSEKCVLALATVHRYFVCNSFDNVERFFFNSCWCKENLRISLLFFSPQFNLWSSLPPSWKVTRNLSSEQWCLLLTFEKEKLSRQPGFFHI